MIRIVEAAEEDMPKVLDIECASISPPWSEGALLGELGREDGLFVLAEEDNDIAGFCIVRYLADEAELYQIAVRPDRRRNGVGDHLMTAALDDCRKHGVLTVYLEVRRSNDAAIKLYKKYGFKTEGRRKNYYSSPVEDAVIMMLALSANL